MNFSSYRNSYPKQKIARNRESAQEKNRNCGNGVAKMVRESEGEERKKKKFQSTIFSQQIINGWLLVLVII